MKKIIYLIVLSFVWSCNTDSSNNEGSLAGDGSGQGGSLAKFAIAGDYLYAVDQYGLNVFNITEASNPVLVNQETISFDIETIFSYKEYLYIGSQSGMFIYSIARPEFPEQLSSVEHFTACDPVVANETHAFVTLWSDIGCGNIVNQLEIYNVEDPINPILLSTRNLTYPKGLGLYGNYLLVCDDEIKVFDITNPEDTTLVHAIDREVFDVIINENVLIAVGQNGVYQYALDENNIENTQLLSEITL